MKAYISKYALTADVYEVEGAIEPTAGIHRLFIRKDTREDYILGVDAHETREAALADAEARREARIKALEKQIVKLKALKFK